MCPKLKQRKGDSKMKKVYKYGTGEKIPKGAVYLHSLAQRKVWVGGLDIWQDCWLAWHYFLVDVDKEKGGEEK